MYGEHAWPRTVHVIVACPPLSARRGDVECVWCGYCYGWILCVISSAVSIIVFCFPHSSQEPGRAGSRVTFSPTRNDPCKKFRTSGIFRCGRYDKRCSSKWWRKNSSLSASLRPPHPPRHSGHLSATRKGQLMKTVQPGQAPASAAGRAHEDGKARAGTGECRG